MKHVIRVTEFLTKYIVIEADSIRDAVAKANKAHYDGLVTLDDRNYEDVAMTHVRIACPGDIERYEEVEVNEL